MLLNDISDAIVAKNCNLSGSSFRDVKMDGTTFDDISLVSAAITDANLSGVSIADCNIDGMTIDGVLVADLFKAYRSQRGAPGAAS